VNTPEDGHVLTTVGLDLGDKTIQACFVDHHGEIVPKAGPRQVGPLVLARPLTLSVGRTRLRLGSQQSNGFTDRPRIIQRPPVGTAYPEAR